jgi:Fe-S-cluster containining protein
MTQKKPDCLTCGACCICQVDQEYYVDLTPEDMYRLGKSFIKSSVCSVPPFDTLAMIFDGRDVMGGVILTKWRIMRSGPFKSYEMNTCKALRGSVMQEVSCSIYKKRPRACREAIKPGDKSCREVRRAFQKTIKDLELPEGDGLYRAYLNGVR